MSFTSIGYFANVPERIYLSFFSNKLRVGIIGGGKAAIIKIRSFLKRKVYVEVLAREFSKDILDINDKNLKLIKAEYKSEFIQDKTFNCNSNNNHRDTANHQSKKRK